MHEGNGSVDHIGQLKPDTRNPRKHNPRNIGMIVDSLHHVGAARSIVIDEDDNILAGNGVVEAAAQAGIERVRVVEADGQELIAVRRRGLTEEQRQKLKYYDNQTGAIAEWDAEQIAKDLEEGMDLKGVFDQQELAEILASVKGEPPEDPGPQIDRAAELQELWHTELGQLWELGNHRLICGDCTDRDVVGRLLQSDRPSMMVTDPPYGVGYDPEWRVEAGVQERTHGKQLEGDDRADWSDAWTLFPGDVVYIWHASTKSPILAESLEQNGFVLLYLIIWNKDLAVFGRGDYHHKYEPCWYAVRKGKSHHFVGDRKQKTVWDIPTIHSFKNGRNEDEWGLVGHSTQKPIECMERPIRNHDFPMVYDPFLGSGTTMVAAERLGRRCFGIEIDPGYVAVALQRWTDMTGRSPVLVNCKTAKG